MKLASVGIDPDHVEFTADHVSIHDSTDYLSIGYFIIYSRNSRFSLTILLFILETPGFFY